MPPPVFFAVAGLAAGFHGGLLGLGGGTLLVPLLYLWLRVDLYEAVTCSLVCGAFVGGAAALRFRREGRIRKNALLWLYAGSLPAVALGHLVTRHAPEGVIRTAFIALLVWSFWESLFLKGGERNEEDRFEGEGRKALFAAAGSAAGFVAGAFGVGGGIMATPLQRLFLGVPVKAAMAHASALMVGTNFLGSLAAAFLRAEAGEPALPWSFLVFVLPGAVMGSWLGSSFQRRFRSRWLLGALAATLLFAAWRMALA